MKLGTQMYSAPKIGERCIQIRYNPDERIDYALNLTGYTYMDRKYHLAKSVIADGVHKVIVTNQDLIACDDYIALIPRERECVIVFVFQPELNNKRENSAFGTIGASKLRLRNAQAKLKASGIKTKFFVSEDTALKYLEGIK